MPVERVLVEPVLVERVTLVSLGQAEPEQLVLAEQASLAVFVVAE